MVTTRVWVLAPETKKVSSNEPSTRTRLSTPAATMPGVSSGTRTLVNRRRLSAPKTFAACSTSGEICSTNGTVIKMTSGRIGTRLTRTTDTRVPPIPSRYIRAAICTA